MGNGAAALGDDGHVLLCPPPDPGMGVRKNGVAQYSARGQDADLLCPLDRRLAVPTDHLLKLIYALSDVHRKGDVPLVGGGEAVPKKLGRAVLDLHRRDDAREPPGGVSGQFVDQLESRIKAFPALLFVPVEPEHMIIFELPAC